MFLHLLGYGSLILEVPVRNQSQNLEGYLDARCKGLARAMLQSNVNIAVPAFKAQTRRTMLQAQGSDTETHPGGWLSLSTTVPRF